MLGLRLRNAPDLLLRRRSGGNLEDVAILTCVAVAALGVTAAYIVADVFGMIIGLGWGYYSKKRKAAKAAKREF
jgi:hypothetical protein